MKLQSKSPNLLRLTSVFLLIGVIASNFIFLPSAYADQIVWRSLTLQANGLNGGSAPGVNVNHLFTFTLPTAGDVGSIRFQYCTTAADVGAGTCVAPTAMDASASVRGSESGMTGFNAISGTTPSSAVSSATTNEVVLTRTAVTNISAGTVVGLQLQNVKNPQALKADLVTNEPNYTFFVRISSYASLDGSGTAIDKGTVTASTAYQLKVTGTMPEALLFCTGKTVPFKVAAPTIPDCANATTGDISFNQLFDQTGTATATSQMSASTNASHGYVITVNGTTLKSGTLQIDPMTASAFPITGASQFGLNLKANDTTYLAVATGAEISPLPAASAGQVFYRGEAINGYDVMNQFKFNDGDAVANSGYDLLGPAPGGTPQGSDAQTYTVTYIANVPGSLPAGEYQTTLTYICTPTY